MSRYRVVIKQYQEFFVDDLTQVEHEYANSDFNILDHEIETVLDTETNTFVAVEDLPEQED